LYEDLSIRKLTREGGGDGWVVIWIYVVVLIEFGYYIYRKG